MANNFERFTASPIYKLLNKGVAFAEQVVFTYTVSGYTDTVTVKIRDRGRNIRLEIERAVTPCSWFPTITVRVNGQQWWITEHDGNQVAEHLRMRFTQLQYAAMQQADRENERAAQQATADVEAMLERMLSESAD